MVRDGIAYPVDWLAIIFNPSFPYRFFHMLTACYLTTSLVVLAVGARYLARRPLSREGRTMVRMGLGMVAMLAPLQLVIGDLHGINTAKHQPQKVAAIEAHWDGSKPAPLVLFAWPDEQAERNALRDRHSPWPASLIITHEADGLFPGLKDFPRDERPPVAPVFFSFRVMVGLGMAMIALGWWAPGCGARPGLRHRLVPEGRGHCWWMGFVALLAGWMVTEIGRQPWIAWGILRTRDAASPVAFEAVALSLALIVVTYAAVFSVGIWYIRKLMAKGPVPALLEPPSGVANRPLSAAQRATVHAARGEATP